MKQVKTTAIALFFLSLAMIGLTGCSFNELKNRDPDAKVAFLHHSTGIYVFKGERHGLSKYTTRLGPSLVTDLFRQYNKENNTKYSIKARKFPSGDPYPWNNYPYDYYNIWVKNAGEKPYMEEPTLEILTKEYDVIIFKHCFPVSAVLEDDFTPDINSDKKTNANYKMQYEALKQKMRSFPDTKFIVWTGAALTESRTSPEEAERARSFFKWVTTEWDEPDDNIFIFDFRKIETGGGLYLKPEYAAGENDPHPNEALAEIAGRLFFERIIEVLENGL